VKTLESGLKNYVSALDNPDVPVELRNEKLNMFSNIFRIYDLHANLLYPALRSCGDDIMKISETFAHFIKNDYFYCYVLFMLNRARSLVLCDEYKEFFHVSRPSSSSSCFNAKFLIKISGHTKTSR
jgi:hypothetical protein